MNRSYREFKGYGRLARVGELMNSASPHRNFHRPWRGLQLHGRSRSTAGRRSQPSLVATHLRAFPEPPQRGPQDFGCGFVGRLDKPVMHPFSFAACGHQTCPAQVREVSRYFGLAHPQDFYQKTDAHLAAREQVHEPQADWIGQSPKQPTESRGVWFARHATSIACIWIDIYMETRAQSYLLMRM